ncbi:hypothetical protein SAMN05444369_105106 [Capnocytophaga haemolytica]|jgi:hypothetical protein|uniref:Uncharacterized protein n=1 Tax=Capnocytophaga haemolytica TaxID=45243 RepID=A0AAX2GYT3_9FLAO|nr:hypothetical protein SAMN05444369_105106 [Capnocytophaga haemolytica]SNV12401.1 Uncharacterised protein [Capnocytophaga haemolytica]
MAVFELKSSSFFSAEAFDETFVGRAIVAGFADAKGR